MLNRTVLVTGASRGIGRAIAQELASRGASVAVNYRSNRELAEQAVHYIQSSGGRAIAIQADLADPAQIESMTAEVQAQLGPIDILVNNAGVLYLADLDHFEPDKMQAMRQVNVDGLVHVTRAVAPSMRNRRFGRIINISSIAGFGTSFPGNTFYAATKAAVITLTKRFAMELGPYGVTVNAIAPGFIETDMAVQGRSVQERQELLNRISGVSMLRRVGKPEDIANVAAFLASEPSGFITAQVLTVDGGRMDYIAHP